jgi:uncharacterized protein (DUF1501 family)
MSISRRSFTVGCSKAIAALAGGRLGHLTFNTTSDTTQRDMLVVIFLRGGCDGLNLIGPTAEPAYIAARRTDLRVHNSGPQAGLALANPLADLDFRLHPEAGPLKELYDSQALAIIHACGLTNGTRSHFEAMEYMERGSPESKRTNGGWLARHILATKPAGLLPVISTSASQPLSLLEASQAVAMPSLEDFSLNGHWKYGKQQQEALGKIYVGSNGLELAGRGTLTSLESVASRVQRDEDGNISPYQPEDGIEYPTDYHISELSDALKTIARLIKLDLGLQVATVDYGGWDTHEEQAEIFPTLVAGLSQALHAFYNDMARYQQRLTVVVISEFGRRLKANESAGTDHGHGNAMLVLGGKINGGRMYGRWPGLANEQLDDGADLAITTDYRTVLSEILTRRLANPAIDTVFPGFTGYQPLGVCR